MRDSKSPGNGLPGLPRFDQISISDEKISANCQNPQCDPSKTNEAENSKKNASLGFNKYKYGDNNVVDRPKSPTVLLERTEPKTTKKKQV
eukprot:jgi/Bigna1/138712/aug1.46_g13420